VSRITVHEGKEDAQPTLYCGMSRPVAPRVWRHTSPDPRCRTIPYDRPISTSAAPRASWSLAFVHFSRSICTSPNQSRNGAHSMM
jgi:hypothetical protein